MDFVLVLIYCVVCAVLMRRMVVTDRLEWCHLGVIGTFSIGYCILPVLLKPLSALRQFSDSDIAGALLLHGVFLVLIVLGVIVGRSVIPDRIGLSMQGLDRLFLKHRRTSFCLSFSVYTMFLVLYAQTAYSAQDLNAFFTRPDASLPILSAVAGLFLAALSVNFALELKVGRNRVAIGMCIAILVIVVLSLASAQRLATITPIATVTAALFATRQRARATKSIGVLVAVLLLVSPFVVFLRETRVNLRSKDRIVSIAPAFSYGEDALLSSIQSIVDRSDLLANSVRLKEYIDNDGYVGWVYYYSVLISAIPKAIVGQKPYLLSSDGTLWGHISVIAWAFDHRGIGSLTAFGAITAYRQGGWIAVCLDGFATGVFFVYLARWLGGGGPTAIVFYCTIFPLIAVKRAPPSLFESLSEFLPLLPFILAMVALNVMVSKRRRPCLPGAIGSQIGVGAATRI